MYKPVNYIYINTRRRTAVRSLWGGGAWFSKTCHGVWSRQDVVMLALSCQAETCTSCKGCRIMMAVCRTLLYILSSGGHMDHVRSSDKTSQTTTGMSDNQKPFYNLFVVLCNPPRICGQGNFFTS